ncbi:hypothetical protein BS50DRAFT_618878 [Corynespora cassiicola Philippines]|uniref:Zn(2)-C6 fungal-type domain-containing protein n=1 Tax=Corynespora cassiicola Philippines TaxID=1448308 RepID=A0A2T2NWW8_CORCC|nr:hypothetical protein BS50DRAFT_618878 [Corynespora cassiicola Philippines]
MQSTKHSRRSPNTCAECRIRKVKCDGRRTVCGGCERLKLSCSFGRNESHAEAIADSELSSARRHKITACTLCHSLKARCDGELPKCKRCQIKQVDCVYPLSRKARSRIREQLRANRSSDPGSGNDAGLTSGPQDDATRREARFMSRDSTAPNPTYASARDVQTMDSSSLDSGLVLRMFESFFQHIHPIPVYSFFHKASLVQRFEAGLLDPGLVLSLVGTASDFLDMGEDMKSLGVDCLSKAESLVMKDIGKPSVIKIQALILIVRHHMRRGRLSNAFMLHSVASRAAYALRLNYEAPKLCFLAQESRRRLMWSLYIVDNTLAGGISDFTLCPANSIHIQLPCQERNFEFDLEQETESLKPTPNRPLPDSIGSLGMYIRLFWFRHRILETTKAAVTGHVDLNTVSDNIGTLAAEFAEFESSLPPSFRFSSKGLELRAYSPRLAPYLLFHVWLRQCNADLYRVALTGLREALREEQIQHLDSGFVEQCRRLCFANARALSEIFRHFPTLKNGCPTMDQDVVAVAYQCARILLYCFRHFGHLLQATEQSVNDCAQQCLKAVESMPSRSVTSNMIKMDIEKLLYRGSSPDNVRETDSSSSSGRMQSTHAAPESATNHLFSRHSMIGSMEITDDSADLAMRNSRTSHNQETTSASTLPFTTDRGLPTHGLIDNSDIAVATDFSISNAFEGAVDELGVDFDAMYSGPLHWFTGFGLGIDQDDIQAIHY